MGNTSIDTLLDSIEQMIDAQDDIWNEEYHCNYREVRQIKEDRYLPAKERARSALRAMVTEIVREEISKSPKAKNWGLL